VYRTVFFSATVSICGNSSRMISTSKNASPIRPQSAATANIATAATSRMYCMDRIRRARWRRVNRRRACAVEAVSVTEA
jgi:hypothetical protein